MVFSCIIISRPLPQTKMQPPHLPSPSPSILSETLFWSFPSVFTPSSPWRHTADHWGGALVHSDWMGWKGSFPLKTCAVLSEYTFVTSFMRFSLNNPGTEVCCCEFVNIYTFLNVFRKVLYHSTIGTISLSCWFPTTWSMKSSFPLGLWKKNQVRRQRKWHW